MHFDYLYIDDLVNVMDILNCLKFLQNLNQNIEEYHKYKYD